VTTPAEIVTLADALVADLQTASDNLTFNRTFQSQVLWANRTILLTDLGILRVDIAPISWDLSVEGRGYWAMLCKYHVGVRKRFDVSEQDQSTGVSSDDEVQQLVQLLSDIACYYMPSQPADKGIRFTSPAEATWVDEPGGQTPVTIHWDMLRKEHQFTGFFPLTYQVTRDN